MIASKLKTAVFKLPGPLQKPVADLVTRLVGIHPFIEDKARLLLCKGMHQAEYAETLRRIPTYDRWSAEWDRTAKGVQAAAEEALTSGCSEAAHQLFYRAALYYSLVDWMLQSPQERQSNYERLLACYDRVRSMATPPIEKVEIPLGHGSMPAHLRVPGRVARPPCVVVFQGLLDIKEHQLLVEDALLQRGLATLSVDQPGVGECTLRGMRLSRQAALEAVEAVEAFLRGRPETNSARIGVFGFSFGGYLAALMAAHHQRVRACATIGAPAHFDFVRLGDLAPFERERARLIYDADDDAAMGRLFKEMDLTDDARRIQCPVLIVHGERDQTVPVSQAQLLYRLVSASKRLEVCPADDHACSAHRERHVLPLVADWFAANLRVEAAVPRAISS